MIFVPAACSTEIRRLLVQLIDGRWSRGGTVHKDKDGEVELVLFDLLI